MSLKHCVRVRSKKQLNNNFKTDAAAKSWKGAQNCFDFKDKRQQKRHLFRIWKCFHSFVDMCLDTFFNQYFDVHARAHSDARKLNFQKLWLFSDQLLPTLTFASVQTDIFEKFW